MAPGPPRDPVPGLEERGVRGRPAEPRALVHREPDAVAEPVHVALLDALVHAHGRVALPFEHVAHELLVAAARLAAPHARHGRVERLATFAVHLLERLGRGPEAERARHVGGGARAGPPRA